MKRQFPGPLASSDTQALALTDSHPKQSWGRPNLSYQVHCNNYILQ